MQSVGQKLRQAREAQGRSLQQVNATTRIAVKVLEAIEGDDLGAISSPFLYKSFVRQFADDVGLRYSDLESGVQTATGAMPVPLVPGEGTNSAPKIPALRVGKRKNSRWMHSISLFAAVVVGCSGLYTAWQKSKSNLPVVARAGVDRKSSVSLGLHATKDDKKPQTRDSIAASPDAPAAPIVSKNQTLSERNKGFTLELSAIEPTWLSIIADGRVSFQGILERAETKMLEGRRSARIKTGNAGGVQVIFNGKLLGALGSRGQVKTVLFTKNDYETVSPTNRVSMLEVNQTVGLAGLQPPLASLAGF